MFAKLVALWIVLLAVSPFTAPFSACELDEVLGMRQEHALREMFDVVASQPDDQTNPTQLTAAGTPEVGPIHPLQRNRLEAPLSPVDRRTMELSPATHHQPATHAPASGPLARRSSTLRL